VTYRVALPYTGADGSTVMTLPSHADVALLTVHVGMQTLRASHKLPQMHLPNTGFTQHQRWVLACSILDRAASACLEADRGVEGQGSVTAYRAIVSTPGHTSGGGPPPGAPHNSHAPSSTTPWLHHRGEAEGEVEGEGPCPLQDRHRDP
jgi:hypothetical protein